MKHKNKRKVFPAIWPHKTDDSFVLLYVCIEGVTTRVIIHPEFSDFIPNSELPTCIKEHVEGAGLQIAIDRNRPGIMMFYDPVLPLSDVDHAFRALLAWSGHSVPKEDKLPS